MEDARSRALDANPEPTGRARTGRRRVAEVEAKLRDGISSGLYPVGSRLPTESQLTTSLDVSRSVLREAVAALRSQGILRSQQGAGVFVLRENKGHSPLSFLVDASATIADVVEDLELRTAVEIEAAGLASLRGSPAQIVEIQGAHMNFAEALKDGRRTEGADAELHRAIARATNNKRFEAFLAHMGSRTIPRAAIEAKLGRQTLPRRDGELHEEHELIVRAIVAKDEAAARDAMRAHLGGSMSRYRQMVLG